MQLALFCLLVVLALVVTSEVLVVDIVLIEVDSVLPEFIPVAVDLKYQ